ncbi:unnamed protein product, partial [Acanthoscelides obtectus]
PQSKGSNSQLTPEYLQILPHLEADSDARIDVEEHDVLVSLVLTGTGTEAALLLGFEPGSEDDVKNLLSGKIDEAMASFKNQVTKLSADISRSMKSSHAVPSVNKPVVSYAEVVRNKTQPALIIQPKNGNHQSKQTKADLIQHVNPCTAEVQLAKVKDVRDGGILIGCKSKEENQKLKAIVQEKLSDSYVIREITGINPRFRLVGMSDKYSDDKLRHLLLKGNTDIFEDDFECKIVKHFPTKKDPSVYQAIVQVDRSSYDKIVKAGYLFVGCEYPIIAITETWLDFSCMSSEFIPTTYNVFRTDRDYVTTGCSRGGGVLIAIDERFTASLIEIPELAVLSALKIDVVAVKVCTNSFSVYICNVYIPPDKPNAEYEQFYDAILSSHVLFDRNLVITGDFNIANYTSYANSHGRNAKLVSLNNFAEGLAINQFNNISNSMDNTLDLVFCSGLCEVEHSWDPLLDEDPYHPALNICCNVNSSLNTKHNFPVSFINSYNFRKANFPQLYNLISDMDWAALDGFHDANEACEFFYNKLYNAFDTCVPKYARATKRKYPPWFNSAIIKLIKRKEKIHRSYRRNNDPKTYQTFRELRSKIRIESDEAYKIYVRQAENEIQRDSNKFWGFLNSKRKSTNLSSRMIYNGNELLEPNDILNAFADNFSKYYSSSSATEETDNFLMSNEQPLNITRFEEDEVVLALKQIKPKMTTGPDNVPAFILRDCASVLACPLTVLFNLCLTTCTIPELWKLSKVCPIHKNGSRNDVSNFRPISILCNFSKALEILIYNRLYHHVSRKICVQQHGFMKGRSTVSNLMNFTQTIAENIDRGLQTDVVYTDFSKAFDRVDHRMLLHKLKSHGLSDPLIQLFKSYLTGRNQFVMFNGIRSSKYVANSGVPQGSNLGPLLFVIFVNDIVNAVGENCLLYADDLKMFCRVVDESDCDQLLENLVRLDAWCSQNNLSLNINKCYVMSYTLKKNPLLFDYTLSGSSIQRTSTLCDLGVTFDSQLTFVKHIDSKISEANRMYGFIVRNCRDFTQSTTLKLLYYAYVRSKLEYALLIWNPHHIIHISRLECVQRRFLKYLSLKVDGVYPPIGIPHDSLLEKHLISSLEARRTCQSVIFLFKLINNASDDLALLGQLSFNVPRLTSRQNVTFYLPAARTNYLHYSPLHVMCRNYNSASNRIDIFNCRIADIKNTIK